MNQELKNLQQKYCINLFEWYDFPKDSKVLVFGDVDDNFIFPIAKRVGELHIVIHSKDAERLITYLSLPANVKLYTDYVEEEFGEEMPIDKSVIENKLRNIVFDYVLVPSFTEKVSKSLGNDLNSALHYACDTFTKGNGTIIVPFDNKNGFNVIAGYKLEEKVLSFGKDDIDKIEGNVKLYYPMPEYKFPLRIYSDNYLPRIDDENDMTRNLVRRGVFNRYCNSYIVIFSEKESTITSDSTIFVKYNINRAKRFAIRTSIVEDKEKKKSVIKKAAYKEANDHVKEMVKNADIIKNPNVKMLKASKYVDEKEAKDNLSYAVYPYLEGEAYTDIILKRIANGEKEKEVLFEGMLKLIGKYNGIIENYNLDCTFQNAIVKDKEIYVIDSEWAFNDTTEVDYLKYRILKYFYNACKQYLSYNSFNDMVKDFDIQREDAERYENAENTFQTKVHESIHNLDTEKYKELNPLSGTIYYVSAELERLRSQLDKITGDSQIIDYQANKQNEIIRLTKVHVFNLEAIIGNLQEQVKALSEQNAKLFKRESLVFKVVRKIKNIIKKSLPPETIRSKICKYIYRTFRHPIKMLKTFFTSRGRNRIIGDFMIGDAYFECGKVSFPKCDNPLVSIIIPCYNQIRYTYKCLYSIMKNTDKDITPYEVIIADDVSTDTTKNISKYVENIIVNRNTENLGFLKNCNAAAKLAKGKYIYFLNNDTEVKENYLSSLVDLIESDKAIGMVGSKLIFSDGTLQEAGGIIWSDGSGANYGRGDDPENFKYNYVREVDYISGAAIMIKKSLWDIIGGFDERFAPAYCEDSDLAFEVRKFGYKVMYQPRSVVIHYEGKSCGTDVNDSSSIKSYQVINTEKLKEKWAEDLTKQYPHTDRPNFYKARERGMNKKVILFIDHYIPTWDKDAGSKTVFSYMMMFKKMGYSIKCLGDNFLINSPYGEQLEALGVEVLCGNDLQATIWEYLGENSRNIDFVFLNRPHIATKYIDFIKQNMTAKIIYYGHDLHYMRLKREYDLTGDDNALSESKYYRNLEYSLIYKSDMSYYPSYKEVEEIRKIDNNLKVKAINAYIFGEKELVTRDFTKTQNLLFVGGFLHEPNKDALRWLHTSIMPRIKARNKNINLNVVGSNADEEMIKICKEGGYNLFGYVSDEELKKLYAESRVVVAPLRYGAGIKGKIVEAMANGAAIVTTDCGAEGIVDASTFMKIANDALDFAQEVLKIYDDMESLKYLSLEAQKVINRKFTMNSAWNIIKDDFI